MRAGVVLVSLALAACGREHPVATPPSPATAVVTVPSASSPSPASESVTSVPEQIQPPAPVSLVQACQGTALDLRWVALEQACLSPGGERLEAPPGALDTRLEPATIRLAPGGQARAMVVIANITGHPLEFDLDTSCAIGGMSVIVIDNQGQRADVIQRCGYTDTCGGPLSRLLLDGNGDARIGITVQATTRQQGDDCQLGSAQPMKPGCYQVHVVMPSGPPRTTTSLIVGD